MQKEAHLASREAGRKRHQKGFEWHSQKAVRGCGKHAWLITCNKSSSGTSLCAKDCSCRLCTEASDVVVDNNGLTPYRYSAHYLMTSMYSCLLIDSRINAKRLAVTVDDSNGRT